MDDPYFKSQLDNLQKLHDDLEKQMHNFDEVVPYGRQRTADIYSPRLLNLMLVCGAHIEAITRLISLVCGFPNNGGIPSLIRKINENAVLSKFEIVSISHGLQFAPFTDSLDWWDAYNELKHDLVDKSAKITYTTVMDTFAALAALHCLSQVLFDNSKEDVPKILDKKNWIQSGKMAFNITSDEVVPFWESLLFEIRSHYLPNGANTIKLRSRK